MRNDDVRIGLVIPLQGSTGIFGPSCEAVAATALREINRTGLLGRQVSLEIVDGGGPVQDVAERVGALLDARRIDALTGWHTSAAREALAPVTAGRVPYAYTSLYEGGEQRPGVFCTGWGKWSWMMNRAVRVVNAFSLLWKNAAVRARAAQEATQEAPRRQGLRPSSLPDGVPRTLHPAPDCSSWRRDE